MVFTIKSREMKCVVATLSIIEQSTKDAAVWKRTTQLNSCVVAMCCTKGPDLQRNAVATQCMTHHQQVAAMKNCMIQNANFVVTTILFTATLGDTITMEVVVEQIGRLDLYNQCLFHMPVSLRKHTYSNTLKILPPKIGNFSEKTFWYFSYFCSKHRLWVLIEAVLTSTHNLCFWAEITK